MDVNNFFDLWLTDTDNVPLSVNLLEQLALHKDSVLAERLLLTLSEKMYNEPTVLAKVIELYIKLIQHDKAFEYAKQLVNITNNHSLALHYLVLTSFLLQKNEDVIQLSREFTLLPESYLFVARAEYLLGNIDTSIKIIEQYNLTSDEALGVLSIMKLDAGLFDEAFKLANQVLLNTPHQFEALITTATQFCMDQDYSLADEKIDLLLSYQPKNGRVLSLKGQVFFYKTDFPNAIKILTLSTDYMPEHVGTWHLLAWAYFLTDRFENALKCFEDSLLLDRNFSESHGGLACVHAAMLNSQLAEKSAKLAVKLNKFSFSGRYAQAILLEQSGEQDKSKQLIKEITSTDSGYGNTTFAQQISTALKKRT